MSNLTYQEYYHDKKTIAATLWCLCQIGENVGNLSSELKNRHSEIPWSDIAGLRNRIVHDYGSTDYSIVYQTLTMDLAVLNNSLKRE